MQQHSVKIWLLGASFETSNMGVSALAEASLKCIFAQWPDAEVTLLTYGKAETFSIDIAGHIHHIHQQELWFGRNIFKPNNAYVLLFYALLLRILPFSALKRWLALHNSHFNALLTTDLVADITGGDSFSDIYGLNRYIKGSLLKLLVILAKRPFVLLPQTYGPFNSRIAKILTRYLLNRSTAIYSRDASGLAYVNQLLGTQAKQAQQIRAFMPDVAFTLDVEAPKSEVTVQWLQEIAAAKAAGKTIIGFNISGLLYNDMQKSEQRFGIASDYRDLVTQIIQQCLAETDTLVVLVPHVFAPPEFESDPTACTTVYNTLQATFPQRILNMPEPLNHRQVKYVIGECDFFMGSRMHACIGAMSQRIPTVGLAYSGKFVGVFESAGVADAVVDLRSTTQAVVLEQLQHAYAQRAATQATLATQIPQVQTQVLGLFAGVVGLQMPQSD